MKFYHIAIVVFAFSLSVSIINTSFIATGIYDIAPRLEMAENVSGTLNDTIDNLETSVGQISSGSNDLWDFAYTVSFFIHGIGLLVGTIGNATIMLPWMLNSFWVPPSLAWGISAMVWLCYGFGFIQFLANKNAEGMS